MNGAMPRWCYWVSAYFVLDTMQAFGFIERNDLSALGRQRRRFITQTLNLLMIAASLMLFGVAADATRGLCYGYCPGLVGGRVSVLSALWSLDPAASFRVGVVYLFVIIGVIGIARAMDADEFMHLLSWCCFLSALASIVLPLLLPRRIRGGGQRGDAEFQWDIPS